MWCHLHIGNLNKWRMKWRIECISANCSLKGILHEDSSVKGACPFRLSALFHHLLLSLLLSLRASLTPSLWSLSLLVSCTPFISLSRPSRRKNERERERERADSEPRPLSFSCIYTLAYPFVLRARAARKSAAPQRRNGRVLQLNESFCLLRELSARRGRSSTARRRLSPFFANRSSSRTRLLKEELA